MLVSGRLRRKKEIYHVVISYVNRFTKKRIFIEKTTGTKNKKEAESMLQYERLKITKELKDCWKKGVSDLNEFEKAKDTFFIQYYENWLNNVEKFQIEESTFLAYKDVFQKSIKPYFEPLNITMVGLTTKNIQDYYSFEIEKRNVSNNTIRRRHANIRKCLQHAYLKDRLIDENPATFVELPKKILFVGDTLTKEELKTMIEKTKGEKIWLGIFLAGIYGLSRSEVVGLKWKNIDLQNDVFYIGSTITQNYSEGKTLLIQKNRAKNKSRFRALPIIKEFKEYLINLKKEQEKFQKLYGETYKKENIDYVYLDPNGEIIKPDYLSKKFPQILERLHLKKIRFHDLRHTCTSILHYNGVNIKSLQAWLGHSNPTTTMNIYAHLLNDIQLENKELLENLYKNI